MRQILLPIFAVPRYCLRQVIKLLYVFNGFRLRYPRRLSALVSIEVDNDFCLLNFLLISRLSDALF